MRPGTHEAATQRSMSPGYRTLSDKMYDVDNTIIHGIQTIQSRFLNNNNLSIKYYENSRELFSNMFVFFR